MSKELNKEQYQKLPSKMIRVIICIFMFTAFSCKTNNDSQNQYNLKSFFTITKWNDFNDKTLKENNLSHFIKDKIDFFDRETFFQFMKDSKYNNSYDDFFLIEIKTFDGERDYSKKILVINNDGKLISLCFEKALKWNEVNLSKEEINEFKYDSLKIGTNSNDDSFILTTHIKSDKY